MQLIKIVENLNSFEEDFPRKQEKHRQQYEIPFQKMCGYLCGAAITDVAAAAAVKRGSNLIT
jgi:hypothetical protein